MFKTMGGDKGEWEYPIMTSCSPQQESGCDQAHGQVICNDPRSEYLSGEGRRRRERTVSRIWVY